MAGVASGIELHQDALAAYSEFQSGNKYEYILFSIQEKTDGNVKKASIAVDKTKGKNKGEKPETDESVRESKYQDFCDHFPDDECRWAVYDFWFEKDGGLRNKIVFFSWAPDNITPFKKMTYASSKQAMRNSLLGVGAEIQANDRADLEYKTVLHKVSRV